MNTVGKWSTVKLALRTLPDKAYSDVGLVPMWDFSTLTSQEFLSVQEQTQVTTPSNVLELCAKQLSGPEARQREVRRRQHAEQQRKARRKRRQQAEDAALKQYFEQEMEARRREATKPRPGPTPTATDTFFPPERPPKVEQVPSQEFVYTKPEMDARRKEAAAARQRLRAQEDEAMRRGYENLLREREEATKKGFEEAFQSQVPQAYAPAKRSRHPTRKPAVQTLRQKLLTDIKRLSCADIPRRFGKENLKQVIKDVHPDRINDPNRRRQFVATHYGSHPDKAVFSDSTNVLLAELFRKVDQCHKLN